MSKTWTRGGVDGEHLLLSGMPSNFDYISRLQAPKGWMMVIFAYYFILSLYRSDLQ